MTKRHPPRPDRRVERTRAVLRDALAALMREKDYDDIVVKEILDRANVGRSTFYAHFRDKDELLVSGMDVLLEATLPASSSAARGVERVLAFSRAIFEHHHRHRHSPLDHMGPRGRGVLHQHLERELAATLAREIPRSRRVATGPRIAPELLARYVASTFVLVLGWWLEKDGLSPARGDEVFRALVMPTLSLSLP